MLLLDQGDVSSTATTRVTVNIRMKETAQPSGSVSFQFARPPASATGSDPATALPRFIQASRYRLSILTINDNSVLPGAPGITEGLPATAGSRRLASVPRRRKGTGAAGAPRGASAAPG